MEGNDTVGKRIRRLRKDAHISQEVLSDAIGISRQSISKWEKGHTSPELKHLKKLSEFFNVDLNYFQTVTEKSVTTAESEAVATTETDYAVEKTKQSKPQISKKWLVASVVIGIIFVVFTIYTICVGIIVCSYNQGIDVVESSVVDDWNFYIAIVINVLLFVIELIIIIYIKKFANVNRK